LCFLALSDYLLLENSISALSKSEPQPRYANKIKI
jgi:hypothetical protein